MFARQGEHFLPFPYFYQQIISEYPLKLVPFGSDGYNLEVGGDFVLGTGSSVLLSSNAVGITTLKLSRDFDVQATGLASGNLHELRLTLEGTAPQTLEAAVTLNETFRIHTLTLDTDYVLLVNNHVNLGADEFFKTSNLVNIGDTTLNLNGLQFFVGNIELTQGVYDTFGGSLTVIPEPSTFLLLGGVLSVLAVFRRRK